MYSCNNFMSEFFYTNHHNGQQLSMPVPAPAQSGFAPANFGVQPLQQQLQFPSKVEEHKQHQRPKLPPRHPALLRSKFFPSKNTLARMQEMEKKKAEEEASAILKMNIERTRKNISWLHIYLCVSVVNNHSSLSVLPEQSASQQPVPIQQELMKTVKRKSGKKIKMDLMTLIGHADRENQDVELSPSPTKRSRLSEEPIAEVAEEESKVQPSIPVDIIIVDDELIVSARPTEEIMEVAVSTPGDNCQVAQTATPTKISKNSESIDEPIENTEPITIIPKEQKSSIRCKLAKSSRSKKEKSRTEDTKGMPLCKVEYSTITIEDKPAKAQESTNIVVTPEEERAPIPKLRIPMSLIRPNFVKQQTEETATPFRKSRRSAPSKISFSKVEKVKPTNTAEESMVELPALPKLRLSTAVYEAFKKQQSLENKSATPSPVVKADRSVEKSRSKRKSTASVAKAENLQEKTRSKRMRMYNNINQSVFGAFPQLEKDTDTMMTDFADSLNKTLDEVFASNDALWNSIENIEKLLTVEEVEDCKGEIADDDDSDLLNLLYVISFLNRSRKSNDIDRFSRLYNKMEESSKEEAEAELLRFPDPHPIAFSCSSDRSQHYLFIDSKVIPVKGGLKEAILSVVAATSLFNLQFHPEVGDVGGFFYMAAGLRIEHPERAHKSVEEALKIFKLK